jgi:hypothetical protein
VPEWEPFDERERLEIVRDILRQHPEHDIANSLGGALAGPASPERPDVPVWDYLRFIESHPSTPLSELTAIRFPVLHFEGVSSVASIDEWLRPPPSHLKTAPRSIFVIDAESLIRRYAMEHDAGLVEWDPRSRGIRYLAPFAALRPVMQAWFETLARAD